jgi:hypothetical protein
MKAVESLTLAVAAVISFPAAADIVTLNFDDVTPNAQILNFYNGGMDGSGKSGPNNGVVFSGPAFAIGTSSFVANVPSGSQMMTLGAAAGATATATLDFAAGFDAFSVMFSSIGGVTIDIWSGLDGTGTKLFSTSLSANDPGNNCSSAVPYCNWDPISVGAATLAGTGESVVFGGLGNSQALFDDVTLTTGTVPSPVPEPGSVPLVAMALAAMAWVARRRHPV